MWVAPALRQRLEWGLYGCVLLSFALCLGGLSIVNRIGLQAAVPLGLAMGLAIGFVCLFAVLRHIVVAEPFCAMCRLPRAKVEALVAAEAGALCTECVPLSLAILDHDKPGPRVLAALRSSLQFVTESLDVRTPRAESSRFFSAAVALHSEPGPLRQLSQQAWRVSNPSAVLEALGRILEPERTSGDRLMASAALSKLARYAEARRELEPLDPTSLTPVERALVLNNGAWFALKLEPGLSGDALAQARAQAEESSRLLHESCSPLEVEACRVAFAGSRAALALQAGEPQAALALLEQVEAAGGKLEAEQWLIRGEARAALDDKPGARQAWEKAAEVGHPESLSVLRARERLGGA
jgi:tetratricopeptide (TPR) repeat protein